MQDFRLHQNMDDKKNSIYAERIRKKALHVPQINSIVPVQAVCGVPVQVACVVPVQAPSEEKSSDVVRHPGGVGGKDIGGVEHRRVEAVESRKKKMTWTPI
jgi:hypothetical protein